jgi:pSer/pThr/pTyr-binding forkhead associated (FHA) protein
VHCDHCGQQVPDDANFCPSCGSALRTPDTTGPVKTEDTTAALEVGVFDPEHEVTDLPDLAAGTGMLVVVRGPNAGSRYLLDREETSVGRHADADIFLDDVTVSRRHVTLRQTEHGIVLQDNGSLNGSYVNGDRVEERGLATGDEVQIGRFKLMFVGGAGVSP